MKSEIERLREAVRRSKEFFKVNFMNYATEEIDAILNPPTEMETVEVIRWTFGDGCDTFATEDEARDNATQLGEVYKLTGSYQRVKKQPIEKSVSVEGIRINDVVQITYCQRSDTLFADFKGRIVTLTATCTE